MDAVDAAVGRRPNAVPDVEVKVLVIRNVDNPGEVGRRPVRLKRLNLSECKGGIRRQSMFVSQPRQLSGNHAHQSDPWVADGAATTAARTVEDRQREVPRRMARPIKVVAPDLLRGGQQSTGVVSTKGSTSAGGPIFSRHANSLHSLARHTARTHIFSSQYTEGVYGGSKAGVRGEESSSIRSVLCGACVEPLSDALSTAATEPTASARSATAARAMTRRPRGSFIVSCKPRLFAGEKEVEQLVEDALRRRVGRTAGCGATGPDMQMRLCRMKRSQEKKGEGA